MKNFFFSVNIKLQLPLYQVCPLFMVVVVFWQIGSLFYGKMTKSKLV